MNDVHDHIKMEISKIVSDERIKLLKSKSIRLLSNFLTLTKELKSLLSKIDIKSNIPYISMITITDDYGYILFSAKMLISTNIKLITKDKYKMFIDYLYRKTLSGDHHRLVLNSLNSKNLEWTDSNIGNILTSVRYTPGAASVQTTLVEQLNNTLVTTNYEISNFTSLSNNISFSLCGAGGDGSPVSEPPVHTSGPYAPVSVSGPPPPFNYFAGGAGAGYLYVTFNYTTGTYTMTDISISFTNTSTIVTVTYNSSNIITLTAYSGQSSDEFSESTNGGTYSIVNNSNIPIIINAQAVGPNGQFESNPGKSNGYTSSSGGAGYYYIGAPPLATGMTLPGSQYKVTSQGGFSTISESNNLQTAGSPALGYGAGGYSSNNNSYLYGTPGFCEIFLS